MATKLLVNGLVAVVVGAALTGCGGRVTPGVTVTRSFGPAELVLRVDLLPGFAPQEWRFTQLPIISVYGDGRVITAAAQPAIYPGPALAGLQIQHIPTSDVHRLVDLATRAGVGSGQDLGSPPVADASSTHFAVLTDTGLAQTTAYALADFDDAVNLTRPQRAARAALKDFVNAVSDLGKTLGSVPPPVPYAPLAVVAIAQPWTDPNNPSVPTPPPVAWPGPALPGQYLGGELTCVTATGATADAVMAAAAHANTITPWTFGGSRWMLALRPLLPDEMRCQDLIH